MARIDADSARFHVTCAGYTMECTPDGLPLIYDSFKAHAALVDVMGVKQSFKLGDGPAR